jgi:hypothetical protein
MMPAIAAVTTDARTMKLVKADQLRSGNRTGPVRGDIKNAGRQAKALRSSKRSVGRWWDEN